MEQIMEVGDASERWNEGGDPRIGLVVCTAVLLSLGTVMVYSVCASSSELAGLMIRHVLWCATSLIALLVAYRVNLRVFLKWAPLLLLVGVGLLVAVLVVGSRVNGARRWLRFGGIGFQPAEFVKLSLVFFIAWLYSEHSPVWSGGKRLFLGVVVIMMLCALIIKQPDYGTCVILAATGMGMLFVGGASLLALGGIGLVGVSLLAVELGKATYRVERLKAFLNPWKYPDTFGYHVIQSMVSMGHGGMFGVGLGLGTQKVKALPMAYSDFVFAVVGEEMGHIGCVGVMIAFGLFFWYGMKVIAAAEEDRGMFLLGVGVLLLMMLQGIINLGVATACLPTKGLPLPFVSFGGSNLVVCMVSVGILLNIATRRET